MYDGVHAIIKLADVIMVSGYCKYTISDVIFKVKWQYNTHSQKRHNSHGI